MSMGPALPLLHYMRTRWWENHEEDAARKLIWYVKGCGHGVDMPELSRFFGVIIRMYVEAGGPHHLPHFHAYYQDDVAVVGLDPVELIAGSLPRRQRRLVRRGRSFIKRNYSQIGFACRPVSRHCPLPRWSKAKCITQYSRPSISDRWPFTLRVDFDDGTDQVIDFRPVLAGELFGPLLDPSLFNQVAIDPEVPHTGLA